MASSGVYDSFNINRDQIISDALYDLGVLSPEANEVPTASQLAHGNRILNSMIKSWQTANIGLWLYQEAGLVLEQSAKKYLLGPQGAHASLSLTQSTALDDGSLGDPFILVTDVTGMVAGDTIGVILDSGDFFWTTVVGIGGGYLIEPYLEETGGYLGPSTLEDNGVSIADALPDSITLGAAVYYYHTGIPRPLAIPEARIRDNAGNDTPLTIMTRDQYMATPMKGSSGKTNSYWYDPQMGNGVLYVWPVNSSLTDTIFFTMRVPVQDFTKAADSPNFPIEWANALHLKLALLLSPSYQTPMSEFQRLQALAMLAIEEADGFDREQGSVFFTPEYYPG